MAGCGTPLGHPRNLSAASASLCLQHSETLTDHTLMIVWLSLQFRFKFQVEMVHLLPIWFKPITEGNTMMKYFRTTGASWHALLACSLWLRSNFIVALCGCPHWLKDKKLSIGRARCGGGRVLRKKKAKVTVARQCLWGPIKWAIHRCWPTSLWSQGDTPIEWGPGWPRLFVPSWPLGSSLASAPLTWSVPAHW